MGVMVYMVPVWVPDQIVSRAIMFMGLGIAGVGMFTHIYLEEFKHD